MAASNINSRKGPPMPERIPPVDDELAELLEAVANRDLSTADQKRLAQMLAADSDARVAFIQATAFDAILSHEFPSAEPRVASSALDLPDAERPQPCPQRTQRRTRLLSLVLVGIAASALIVISLVLWHSTHRPVATLALSESAAW